MSCKKNADKRQRYCEREAKRIVLDWFINNDIVIDPDTITFVWLAYTTTGYRCMVTSKTYPTRFFEIAKNVKTGEMVCNCFELCECLVHPSASPILELHENPSKFV